MIPTVQTERLILREQRQSDFEAYADFWASERSKRVGGPYGRSESWDSFAADAGHWLLRGFGMWMVEEKSSHAPVGWIGFYHPDRYSQTELGWILFEEFEGKGYATEAARAARSFGAGNFDIRRPVSFIDADNTRSIATAERLGAIREATRENENGTYYVYRHPKPVVPS